MDSKESPYKNSYGLQYDDGNVTLERVPYYYTPSDDDIIHTVKDGETIQNIAYHYYQDSGRWGDIADTNVLYNVAREVVPGLQLIIPHGGQ